MFFYLLLLFVFVPLIELYLLIRIGAAIGLLVTIGIVIFTGILGATLARREGLKTIRAIQDSLHAGRMPTDSVIDGLLILIAGGVLLTPGFLTDALGFSLLIPSLRASFREAIKGSFKNSITVRTYGPPGMGPGYGGPFDGAVPKGPDFGDLGDSPGAKKPDVVVEPEDGEEG